jgi:hypothetical protein
MLTPLTWYVNVSAVNMRYIMKVAAAGFAVVLLGATPAVSAGFEQVVVPDPGGAPLDAGIWYPSDAPALPQRLGLFEQTVAAGGAIAGRGLSLILMSHGSGGSFEGHYDTALALAEAGFVVAAVTHSGDNYRDQSAFAHVENRPRHLLDYMLHDVAAPRPARSGAHRHVRFLGGWIHHLGHDRRQAGHDPRLAPLLGASRRMGLPQARWHLHAAGRGSV